MKRKFGITLEGSHFLAIALTFKEFLFKTETYPDEKKLRIC